MTHRDSILRRSSRIEGSSPSWRSCILTIALRAGLLGFLVCGACEGDASGNGGELPNPDLDDEDTDEQNPDEQDMDELDAGETDADEPTPNEPDASKPDTPAPDAGETDAGETRSTRPPSTSLQLPIVKESPGVEPIFDVHRPKDLAEVGSPMPVIVWANGGCFRSNGSWNKLFERWAAAGFVVISLSVKPGGSIVDMLGQTSDVEHKALIDWALAQAQQQVGPYGGRLDTDRIVAAGNSCGGVTALAVAAKDPRVRSVFVLSGSSSPGGLNAEVMKAIKVPVGYVVGGSEDIAGANASMDYDALAAGIPSMIVNRSSGDHQTVSTDETILPHVAEIALHWLDLSLYGSKQAATALRSDAICTSCAADLWTLKAKHLETLER